MSRVYSWQGWRILTAALLALLLVGGYFTQQASADGTAANKLGVAGSNVTAQGPNTEIVVLDETLKVSTVRDLILQLTTECSIVTALTTDTDGENQNTTGRVEMRITLDGKEVPVTQDGGATGGRVVFCDRTYSRTVSDQDGDGNVDKEDDYIATRTANAFNWVAFDAGEIYDNPTNGNNIIDVEVFAKFTATNAAGTCAIGSTCSEALIGNRTLVIENTNAQNTEEATTTDPNPAPAPTCPTYPICP